MWKYCDINQCKEFLLSLNLISSLCADEEKIKILYTLSNTADKHYTHKVIKKRNGKKRDLYVPDFLLKHIQKNILHNILDGLTISKYATAYIRNKNIKENALPHVNKKIILKMDIMDFFDSISYLMVYNHVFKGDYFPDPVRGLITSLCLYDEKLPQGAPTSAAISNLVLKSFDEYIGLWCEKQNITYTRYCDDLTFSGDFDVKKVKDKVTNYLNKMGFVINNEKTHVLTPATRQTVTGIVVNDKMQVIRDYRKKIRQEYYYCFKYGVKSHLERRKIEEDVTYYLHSLLGKVNFVLSINPEDKEFIKIKNYIKEELKKQ